MGLIFSGPSVDELKDAGRLVHDENTGAWLDLEEYGESPLPCQHINLCFKNGSKTCIRCGCERPTEIEPEGPKTIGDWIREVRG